MIAAGYGAGMALATEPDPEATVSDLIGTGGSGPAASPNPADPYDQGPAPEIHFEPYREPCSPAFGGPRLGQRETDARREFIERGGDPACLPIPDWFGSVEPQARRAQERFCDGASIADPACLPWTEGVEAWVRQRLRS